MKVLDCVYKVVKYCIILLVVVYLFVIYRNKTICGYSFALVVGNSMYPAINDGDFLIINQKADYQVGDVIGFYDENEKRITHRIIEINENEVITKGDFNKYNDNPINKNQVIGKVVYISSFLGAVFRNLPLIIFVLVVFVYYKLKNLDEYDKMYL